MPKSKTKGHGSPSRFVGTKFLPFNEDNIQEDFVLSRNLKRRRLSMGQKAAIPLDWSEQIEFNPEPEKIKALGRPKGIVPEAGSRCGEPALL
jgi:hypothetical protein